MARLQKKRNQVAEVVVDVLEEEEPEEEECDSRGRPPKDLDKYMRTIFTDIGQCVCVRELALTLFLKCLPVESDTLSN